LTERGSERGSFAEQRNEERTVLSRFGKTGERNNIRREWKEVF
jgi:hypothetical protein